MIPERQLTQWFSKVGWPRVEQVEQDLLLSRLIVEIANNSVLRSKIEA